MRLVLLGHDSARCVRLVATLEPRGNHELALNVVSEHESSADPYICNAHTALLTCTT